MSRRYRKKAPSTGEFVFQLIVGGAFLVTIGGGAGEIADLLWAGAPVLLVIVVICLLLLKIDYKGGPTERKDKREPILIPNDTLSADDLGDKRAPDNKWSLDFIRKLEWSHFEKLCVAYFRATGYKTSWKRLGADNGIDITLSKQSDNGEIIESVVQCKAWSTKPVGVRYIRELLGSMASVDVYHGIFITTTGYTGEAKAFAGNNRIELHTGEDLLRMIQGLPEADQTKLKIWITAGDYTTPRCPNCGSILCKRVAKKGVRAGSSFWACPKFPNCRFTLPIRSG